jgi:hypothetical protein
MANYSMSSSNLKSSFLKDWMKEDFSEWQVDQSILRIIHKNRIPCARFHWHESPWTNRGVN